MLLPISGAVNRAAITLYRKLFARKAFYSLNQLIYRCSLSGLGVLNYTDDIASGEAAFLSRVIQKGQRQIVFDVGANVGHYAKKVLALNPDAIVYAFEPHPKTFQKLVQNVISPNFYPVNAGVGHSDGVMSLYDYADQDGSEHASLYQDVIERIHDKPTVEHQVNVITLSEFMREQKLNHVDLLKIDTEGNELNVLQGLGKLAADGSVSVVHFEFNEMNVSSRTFFRDFWERLPNYQFYRLLPDGMVELNRYVPMFCEIFAYQNIVAIRKVNV